MSARTLPFLRRGAALAWACLALPALAHAAADTPGCGVGAYRMADGTSIDLGKSEGDALRWRRPDGTTGVFHTTGPAAGTSTLGWTGRPDGLHVKVDCAAGDIDMDGAHGHRIALPTVDTHFDSDGTTLAGRLVMPPGDGQVPVVVLLQGSEHDSAVAFDTLQRRLPVQGVGAFVFDKRGTGDSGGRYTQDFDQLARDAVAAVHEARRLAGARASRVGLQGPSQGGWVAPLAAGATPVDFIIVGFGLAVSVMDEDREAVAKNIEDGRFGAQAMAGALELVDACDALALHPVPAVFHRFAAVRDRYAGTPWFHAVHGDFCFMMLGLKSDMKDDELAALAHQFDMQTPWLYDPMIAIAAAKAPQLWILGQDDIDAPSAETAHRLALLRLAGRPISTAVFPRAEHGIYEYELAPDGSRLSTRQPDGYLRLMVDFAEGRPLRPPYGTAALAQPGD